MNKKIRLDIFLAREGLSVSRESAKREIVSGWVKVNGETIRQPSRLITGDETIALERPGGRFVSRGGEKLLKAIRFFNIKLTGKTAVDLGASTGGFTDCMLKEGASGIFAVDVGYGQFDFSLRNDSRVILFERTNVKDLTPSDFARDIDFVAADLSFISIVKVYENIRSLFGNAEGVILIKPQFEAHKSEHKKGVVKKSETHKEVLKRVLHALMDVGLVFRGLTHSPVKGPAGNIEFLLYFQNKTGEGIKNRDRDELDSIIDDVVDEAHRELNSEK